MRDGFLTEARESDGFGREIVLIVWVIARGTVASGMMRVDGNAAWRPTRPLISTAVSLVLGAAGIVSARHYRCSRHGTVQGIEVSR